MRLPGTPTLQIVIPGVGHLAYNRDGFRDCPEQEAGKSSGQSIVPGDRVIASILISRNPKHVTNPVGYVMRGIVLQHTPDTTASLELPETPCRPPDLKTMLKPGFLKSDSYQ
jgi:hypothetical protein